jgi:hypothetical protein
MERNQSQHHQEQELFLEVRRVADTLAQALNASGMTQDEKASWAMLIPHMRLDQLARLAEVLTQSLAGAAAREMGEVLIQIREAEERCAATQAQTDHEFASGMSAIVGQLRTLERAAKNDGVKYGG